MKITCDLFRSSGKWYTTEDIEISDNTLSFNIPEQVRKGRRLKDMIHVGKGAYDVPFLINIDN